MNVLSFSGYLIKEPRLNKTNTNNISVVNITVASTNFYKKGNGETIKETTLLDLEAWDSAAEFIFNNFEKGDYIVGTSLAKNNKWIDQDGETRYKNVFRINHFEGPFVRKAKPYENS